MSNEIASILKELRRDHRNMAMLLDLIERESNRIFDDGTPDFELLHDVMLYMTVYPDAVHHPKEDRLYAEMKAVRPDLTAGFQRITVDHRLIADQGRKLRDDLAAIEAGNAVSRRTLVAEALRYVNGLRSHMQWEELDLFRRCSEMAADGHRFVIHSDLFDARDPLFGRKVDKSYDRLLERIRSAKDECTTD